MTPTTRQLKLKGTIKSLKKAEGYGFITHVTTGIDHFFHRSVCGKGVFDALQIDQPVEFVAEDGPKGPRATDVTVQ